MDDKRVLERIRRRVGRFIAAEGLLNSGDEVLVACSGGPDSTALLDILVHLRDQLGIGMRVAWFDHGLRGAEASSAEAAAVEQLAVLARTTLMKGRWKRAGGVRASEEAARNARHSFLARRASEAGCNRIAFGHTLDDRAETILLDLARGSGLAGLATMPPFDKNPVSQHGAPVVRPLLQLRRRETRAYVQATGLPCVSDATNDDPRFSRNLVRQQVLPGLEAINPRAVEALARAGDAAREAEAHLSAEALTLFQQAMLGESPLRLDVLALKRAGPALLKRTLVLGAAVSHWNAPNAAQLDHVAALVERERGSYSLEGGVVEVSAGQVVFRPTGERGSLVTVPAAVLEIPGSCRFGPYELCAEIVTPSAAPTGPWQATVDVGDARRLLARSWQPGDRVQLLGMQGSRKLQDLFTDAHLAAQEREFRPVVCLGEEIVWVGGFRQAHAFRVSEQTSRAVRLSATSSSEG
jgi:tRNA(Ile)-lysidine synthase